MAIHLEPVTIDNWQEVIKIDLLPEQWGNVDPPSVLHALCESHLYGTYKNAAIIDGDEMVGFVIYGPHHQNAETYWNVPILIIDKAHQRKGYGRVAMKQVVEEAKAVTPPLKGVVISYRLDNIAAQGLYTSLGFEPFRDDETDTYACLNFAAVTPARTS